jgi:hypothetical protein
LALEAWECGGIVLCLVSGLVTGFLLGAVGVINLEIQWVIQRIFERVLAAVDATFPSLHMFRDRFYRLEILQRGKDLPL